uniref:Coatomer subunit gamma n=2 Tax=Plectus sambesii TaxID=2011161 RepID=A0A914XJ47_9BILA
MSVGELSGRRNILVGEMSRPESPLFDFLESCLRHKCEVVIYEAASAIVRMPKTSSRELAPAVSVLQLFCASPKPSLRFAAVRTLNKISINHPQAVTTCNMDLENLITDQNRSIATLAITTLLKTGAESSVERLMKQISSFVSEISDEFKIVVIDAIRSLCMRYPRKHAVMMSFLATMLRDDGGYEYKKAIVETIISIIEENPDAKETGLSHLCEFIEDCEHAVLATRVLHLLGREGPKAQNPARYIRFVYNRVILEATQVRAAAVTALAKFGALCPELQPSIEVLLGRCLLDTDDEVRDRATYYLAVLKTGSTQFTSAYILNGLQVSVVGLERALQQYVRDPSAHEMPFDLKIVPVSAQPITATERKKPSVSVDLPTPASKKEDKMKATRQDVYAEQLRAIPEFARLGALFRSSEPIELTESETEYNVVCVKHTFSDHVLLQFDCRNTLNDQLLENVFVELEPQGEEGWEVETHLALPSLPYNQLGSTYTLVKMPDGGEVTGAFNATLKFLVKDVDPNTGEPEGDDGYEDSYV